MAARYIRYIVFAVACVVVIFLFSSSSGTSTRLPNDLLATWKAGQKTRLGSAPIDTLSTSPNPNYPTQSTLKTAAPGPRMNATFVTLARNTDVWDIAESIRQVEDRFNHRYNYDWVFLNDNEFDETFKTITTALVSGRTYYGLIPKEHWSFPEWIDQDKAAEVRKDMADRKIIYGDSISYRHMCRFESGFFFRQPLMMQYEWYWRVEPSIKLYCDIDYDPFQFMAENNKKYSFVLSLYEYYETIPTMWDSVKKFIKTHPEHISENNSMDFLSDDGGETYNKCHFWSNFEIGNLHWLRSKPYLDFFNTLDQDGGFFYERWGDAPVHSIGAGLLLPKDQIHFFHDIAYWHIPFTHCPEDEATRIKNKCHCNPADNFDWNGYSCTNRFYDLHGMQKPSGAPLTDKQKRKRIVFIVVVVVGIIVALGAIVAGSLKKKPPRYDLGEHVVAQREFKY